MAELQNTKPVIALTEEHGRFVVRVRPLPHDQSSVEEFASYIEARTHARMLRFSRDWLLADRVPPGTRQKAEAVEAARLEARRAGRPDLSPNYSRGP